MTSISFLYEGVDITDDVDFSQAPRFTSRASGDPGDGLLRVLDKHHVRAPGYFHTGGTLEVIVDGVRVWDGWVFVARRGYAFDVDDTSNPTATPRYWKLECYDRNLLFTKRFLYLVADPANPGGFPDIAAGTMDNVVIADYLATKVDLTGDDLDTTSGIEAVATPGEFENFVLGEVGGAWREMFDDIVGQTGAVYWIGPDRVIHYADDVTPTAPFKIVDRAPIAGEISCRDLSWESDGTPVATDAFVWGAGRGSEFPTFARYQAADAIADHGVWQWSDTMVGAYKQETVLRRATTYVEGSAQHNRGHKDPQPYITCTIFEPGLTVGMVVDITATIYGLHDTIPVRTLVITFPTPYDVKYDLTLSHTIDTPFASVDTWPTDYTQRINETIPIIGDVTQIVEVIQDPFGPETQYQNPLEQFGIFFTSDLFGRHGDENSNIPPGEGPTEAVYFNVAYFDAALGGQCHYANLSPVGPGGYIGELYSEFWYPIMQNSWFTIGGVEIGRLDPVDVLLKIPALPGDGAGQTHGLLIGTNSLQHPTGAGQLGEWGQFGSVFNGNEVVLPIPASRFEEWTFPDGSDTRHRWGTWAVFAPAWRIDKVAFVCDIDYSIPGTGPLTPIVTGQAGSGRIRMPQSMRYWIRPGIITSTSAEWVSSFRQNSSSWKDGTGVYYTSWPYEPGTLEVSLDGISLRSGIDFVETDPANGEFRLAETHDFSGSLQVSYSRFGDTQSTRFYNGQNGGGYDPKNPGDGDTNFPPVPGKSGGKVYRPKPLGQLGWGTQYDGTNCWATGSAMLLDRHSLGGLQHPNHGSPDNTPPNHRFYSGDTDPVRGGNHDFQAIAWANGWGEHPLNVGFVPWDYFIAHLNEGRGGSVSGVYGTLPDEFRHSATFTGPHEIYCNEQFGDGSFWVVDPLFPRPVLWPYEVMKTYAQSLSSFGHVYVNFSRITGLI